jgi:hypothetical protein
MANARCLPAGRHRLDLLTGASYNTSYCSAQTQNLPQIAALDALRAVQCNLPGVQSLDSNVAVTAWLLQQYTTCTGHDDANSKHNMSQAYGCQAAQSNARAAATSNVAVN